MEKSFHNSIDWLGFIFKCVYQHGWGKFSDLVLRLYARKCIGETFPPFLA